MSQSKTYIVGIREVHVSYRRVVADSVESAKDEAAGNGEEISLEYSHTLDSDLWSVEEDTDNAGCDACGSNDRVEGSKFCADCEILKCRECGYVDDEANFDVTAEPGERVCPDCGSSETYKV